MRNKSILEAYNIIKNKIIINMFPLPPHITERIIQNIAKDTIDIFLLNENVLNVIKLLNMNRKLLNAIIDKIAHYLIILYNDTTSFSSDYNSWEKIPREAFEIAINIIFNIISPYDNTKLLNRLLTRLGVYSRIYKIPLLGFLYGKHIEKKIKREVNNVIDKLFEDYHYNVYSKYLFDIMNIFKYKVTRNEFLLFMRPKLTNIINEISFIIGSSSLIGNPKCDDMYMTIIEKLSDFLAYINTL